MHHKPSFSISVFLLFVFFCSPAALAADQPIAIFHAFDQSFNDINTFVCQLARQGYSHIQIPPVARPVSPHSLRFFESPWL